MATMAGLGTVKRVNAIRLAPCLWCGIIAAATNLCAEDLRVKISRDQQQLSVTRGSAPVLTYVYGSNQFKPYVRELYAANGLNVLLDGPADHLHHHGLMYAVRVNGVNFWEENDQPGHEIPAAPITHREGRNQQGLPFAAFTQRIHWVAHTNAAAGNTAKSTLLIESRTISVTVDGDEVALDWTGAFRAGAVPVQVHGSGYNGLGLRPPPSFDHVAQRSNSANAPYTPAAAWDVTGGRWSAVAGMADGRDATIVIFSHPNNAGEARFFSMLKPFTYSAATQNLDKSPLRYAAGEEFTVRHLVAVYSNRKTPEFLNERYARWIKETATP